MKEKKKWVKPELVVLVRRKPEEGILTNCRWGGVSGSFSESEHIACYFKTDGSCDWCQY